MANEAVCYETPTRFARYTVAEDATIAKGTILALADPNTAAACSGDDDVCGGIAWMEKVADDGTTEITAALDGTWGLLCSAAGITVGNQVGINGVNEIKVYSTLDKEEGFVLGKALETVVGAVVLKVRLDV